MQLYTTEEELKQLKVLVMVLEKMDLKSLNEISLSVLQINPDNPIAKMLYNLDIRRELVANGINFYSFNAVAVNDYLEEFAKSKITLDKDSLTIHLQILYSLMNILAFSTYGTEETLNLIIECFNKVQPSKNNKAGFYNLVVEYFCEKQSLSALSHGASESNIENFDMYYSSSRVLETRKLCLVSLKKRITDDNEIDATVKTNLISKINGTGLTAQQSSAPQQSGPKLSKWAAIGIGAVVVAIVISFFACL